MSIMHEEKVPLLKQLPDIPNDWDKWENYDKVAHAGTVKVFSVDAGDVTGELTYKLILKDEKNLKQPIALVLGVNRDGDVKCYPRVNLEAFLEDEEFAEEARAFIAADTAQQDTTAPEHKKET